MMGRHAKGRQVKMFYQGISLEQRVRADHPPTQDKPTHRLRFHLQSGGGKLRHKR